MREVDVLVVGAGLSGIAAGYYLQTRLPGKSYEILEARDEIAGTWTLFRYPGVRSDSDMHTLGFSFAPWGSGRSIADGGDIAAYVQRTAREFGIDARIRFDHRVTSAAWSTAQARWTVTAATAEGEVAYRCAFLYMCSGYYDYSTGYSPSWPAMEDFGGRIVHPQFWPQDLDVAGRRIAVIGSGATAVTLVPALAARGAAHVTMVQRTPSYIVALPAVDALARLVNAALPRRAAHAIVRWKNILITMLFYALFRAAPNWTRRRLSKRAADALGSAFVARDFTPPYAPWDQRMCFIPDGDLFAWIAAGGASIQTGTIARFTRDGIVMADGAEVPADIVVTATGLNLKLFGGATLSVDGAPVDLSKAVSYKGMMLSGLPNAALSLGYTNASWTLKCELTSRYVCRLIEYMDRNGFAYCIPQAPSDDANVPIVNLQSGYVRRVAAQLPKQGTRAPWRMHQNYALDMAALRFGALKDDAIRFYKAAR